MTVMAFSLTGGGSKCLNYSESIQSNDCSNITIKRENAWHRVHSILMTDIKQEIVVA